ncbi:hypothetical protein GCM10016455_05820 [Aliiroseovarius zhejiangensis]|uniref:Uncharacterized protein n=1 Tax=Aliiroseovarius zhejiangensis TaxID=1632025 RepID=A0ABQ3IQD5_9RHOB|nr:hypothetical protein [Aliiroseovarius zhejiangensis]GHE88528.1 hypothetical protein GCM10016455_05820 [Aliiroseovarius zhejiangensis]
MTPRHLIKFDEDLMLARELYDDVKGQPPFLRLARMKQLAVQTGGEWDLPHDTPGVYEPIICSFKLAGVHVFAKDPRDLPDEWLNATQDVLNPTDEAAS